MSIWSAFIGSGALQLNDMFCKNRKSVPSTLGFLTAGSKSTGGILVILTLCFALSTSAKAGRTLALASRAELHLSNDRVLASVPVAVTFEVSPQTVTGGSSAQATIKLNGPAPSAGLEINLACNNPAAIVEPNVKARGGEAIASFSVKTVAVATPTAVTITATVGNVTSNAILTVVPPALVAVELDPNAVGGGASTTGEVKLSGPAPVGGILVNLASSIGAAQVQSSIKVPGGNSSATFAVATTAVISKTPITITATLGSASQSATLTISPLALATLAVHPSSVSDGKSATGVVELNSPAGAGGQVVLLSTDNAAATIPASVTIPAGHSSATFAVKTSSVTKQTSVVLTATLGATSKSATLVINPVTKTAAIANPTG